MLSILKFRKNRRIAQNPLAILPLLATRNLYACKISTIE